MAYAIIGEKWDSRNASIGWSNKKADQKFLILSDAPVTDDSDAIAFGDTFAGTTQTEYNLICQGYDTEPLGNGYWLVTVHYGERVPKNPGDSTYNFEIGTQTVKATQSIQTVETIVNVAKITSAPNHHGAIGVTDDGIEGCDILAPSFAFSETHYLPVASVTDDYRAALSEVVGTVNIDTWRSYDAGEVLFIGASGTQRGLDDWEITYKFQVRPNLTDQTIGPFTGIDQLGWDYMWFLYQVLKTDSVPPAMCRTPIACYVEQVYWPGDFTTIGIGD